MEDELFDEIEELNEQNYVEELLELMHQELPAAEFLDKLNDYHENDIAEAIALLSPEERKRLYPILGPELLSEIFAYLEDVDTYIEEMEIGNVARIIENMDSDDAVDVLEELDEEVQEQVTALLDEETSQDIQLIQSYDEDEIGSIMTTNYILIKKDMTVKQAMKSLVSQAEENDNISTLYVEDEDGKYYGALDLKDLITAREFTPLEPLMSTSYPFLLDHDNISESLDRMKDYAEDSIPVLNAEHELIGIITSQDVVEVVDEELSDDYAKLAAMTGESDLDESLLESMKKRLPWLAILLCMAIVVSTVVGLFETVVASVSLVFLFQSMIQSMAGNSGTQSLAVTIRVLMDEDLPFSEKMVFLLKEVRVGFCNGFILGASAFVLVGTYMVLAKGSPAAYAFAVSGCVGVALVLAMMFASLVGTIVPMIFHKLKIDPAAASGPLITTFNDLVAVVTYYGLIWLFMIKILHFA